MGNCQLSYFLLPNSLSNSIFGNTDKRYGKTIGPYLAIKFLFHTCMHVYTSNIPPTYFYTQIDTYIFMLQSLIM